MKIKVTKKLPEGATLISSGALIFDTSGNCIFELRTGDCPYFPGGIEVFGGMREGDESDLDCLHREIFEETNLDFKKQNILPKLIGYQESLTNSKKFNSRYIIENIDISNIKISEESARYVSFPSYEKAISQNKHPLGFSIQGYIKLLNKKTP